MTRFIPFYAIAFLAPTLFGQVAVEPAAVEGTLALAGGGALLRGNRAAYEQHQQHRKDGWGGVEEFRYHRETKKSTLSLKGRALFRDEDYFAQARWQKQNGLYVEGGFSRTRYFYNGAGAFFPPSSSYVPLYDPALHLDRGLLWFEAGRARETGLFFAFRYERQTREGKKPSTQLADTNLTGGFGGRTLVPVALVIDETRDVVTADAGRHSEREHWQAGLRYDRSDTRQVRAAHRRPGEAQSRIATSKEGIKVDLFSAHAFVDRRLREDLRASAGGMITSLDTNLSGSRIFGPDYDAVFDPVLASRQNGDLGLLALGGGEQMKQYVVNLNLVYQPAKHWTIKPTVRYEHLQLDNVANFVATNVLPTLVTTVQALAAQSDKYEDRLNETVEIRYTGKPSWAYTLRADSYQTFGNLAERTVDTATSLPSLDRKTEYTRQSEKFSANATWYVRLGLTFDAEYYFKKRRNAYRATRDSTAAGSLDRYPAFVTDHDFATHDCNARLSWRLTPALSLVSRYDFQSSTVDTTTMDFARLRSGQATTHIFSQAATWTPLPRLYLSGNLNLTFDRLDTANIGLVRTGDNNYLNAWLGGGYALAKATDVFLDLSLYRSDGYKDVSATSLPYGADQRTQSASLTWIHRQTERLVYTVKYTYATNRDGLSGGTNDYRVHIVYSKIQYNF